ncbi:MAG: ATP-binding protein [Solirubrobacteraceae bacterium]
MTTIDTSGASFDAAATDSSSVTSRTSGTIRSSRVGCGRPCAHLHQDELGQLARPFRRLDAERTGSQDGVGLGLSIVQTIAIAHSGTLALHARPQGGLRVAIELPRSRDTVHAGRPG